MKAFAWMVKLVDSSGLPGYFPQGFSLAHSHQGA